MFPSAPNASLGKEMLNFMLRSSKPPQNKNFKVILEDEEGCDNERDDNDVDMNDIRSSGLKAGSEVDGGLRFLNEYMISRNNSNFDELRIPKENNEKVNIVIKDEIIEIDDDEEDDEDDDVITEEEERMIFARQGNLYQMRNIGGIQGSQGALNLSRKQSDTNDDWTNNYDKLRRASVMIKASPAAIDNKIEMALDLLKSHLLYAVKEEVGNLKREVKMIKKGNDRLERENEFMRRANRERLTQNKKNLDDTDINKKPIKIVEFKDETDKNRRSNSIENENEEPVTKMIVKDTKSHPTVAEKQIDSSTQTFPTEDPLQVPGFRSATAHGNQLNKQEGIQSFQEMELKPNRKSTRFLQQLSEPSHTLNMKRSGQTSLPQNNSVENFLSFMPPYDDNTFNNCNLNSENILLTNNSYDSNSYSLLSQYNSQPSSLTSKLLTDLNRQSEMTNFQKGIQKQLRLYQLQQQSSLYPTINLQDPQTEFSDNIFEQQILLERLKLQTLKTNQTCIQQLQQLSRLNRQPLDSDHLSSFFQPQSLPSSLSSSPPKFFNFNPPMVIKPPKNQRLTDIKEGSTLGSELNRLPRISSDPNFNRQ